MRVIRVRAWVRCALWAFLLLLGALLVALWSIPELETIPPRSPRRHLPAAYWAHRAFYPGRYTRSGCISPPTGLHEIQLVAAFWQRVTSEETQVLVFAAYFDEREERPLVRLLVYTDDSVIKLRCLFWYYDKGDPVSAEASIPHQEVDRYQVEKETNRHQVVSCAVPTMPSRETLAAVTLVPADFLCGVTRNLLVIQNLPETASSTTPASPIDPRLEGVRIGVCIVWWRTGDAAKRLAEWLELLRYFGVHRVFLYINNNAHDNVLRVVDYFSWQANLDLMTLDVMPYASPPVQSQNTTSTARELHADFDEYGEDYKTGNVTDSEPEEKIYIQKDDLLPFNECVYRALGERLTWLALLDLDEVIVPLRDGIWERLTVKESRAQRHTGELPDVLDFQRWWFPEMLQIDLTTPPPVHESKRLKEPPSMQRDGPGRFTSPAPPLIVPPGRIFDFKWSSPTARDDATVTGKLVCPWSVTRVQARDVICLNKCQTRYVDGDVARVHLYTTRCGDASRGVCRALRRVAVLNDALWKWRRAQQEAAIELRRLRLRRHVHSHHDDE